MSMARGQRIQRRAIRGDVLSRVRAAGLLDALPAELARRAVFSTTLRRKERPILIEIRTATGYSRS